MDTYKMIAVDLSKQKALDADPRAIQQINFTGNLDRARNIKSLLYSRRSKRSYSKFFTRNSESIVNILKNILQDNF